MQKTCKTYQIIHILHILAATLGMKKSFCNSCHSFIGLRNRLKMCIFWLCVPGLLHTFSVTLGELLELSFITAFHLWKEIKTSWFLFVCLICFVFSYRDEAKITHGNLLSIDEGFKKSHDLPY